MTSRAPASVPHLLLVSGVRAGAGHVGEIILRDLCHAYPGGRMSSFFVPQAGVASMTDPAIGAAATQERPRRYESPLRLLPGPLGALTAIGGSQLLFRRHVGGLIRDAVSFGRAQGVDKVWVVLESITGIAMGRQVARTLGVPLLAQVWDPPEYLLRRMNVDPILRRQIMNEFERSLSEAECVAVVSDAMKAEYASRYGARTVVVHHGLSAAERRAPALHPHGDGVLSIGFAGSMYAPSAWQALMEALDAVGWTIHGRKVVVRVLGGSLRMSTAAPVNIEYLGFRSTSETAMALAQCDVNYLPHPFEAGMADFARLSFPTKLSTYVATGRPLLLHAPEYSSLVPFFRSFRAGACVTSLRPADVVAALESLVESRERYANAAREASRAAETAFNMETFLAGFDEFVGIGRGRSDARVSGVPVATERDAPTPP